MAGRSGSFGTVKQLLATDGVGVTVGEGVTVGVKCISNGDIEEDIHNNIRDVFHDKKVLLKTSVLTSAEIAEIGLHADADNASEKCENEGFYIRFITDCKSLGEIEADYFADERYDTVRNVIEKLNAIVVPLNNAGIYHRDITVNNILYNKVSKEVYLVDFGSARIVRNDSTIIQSTFVPTSCTNAFDTTVDALAVRDLEMRLSMKPQAQGTFNGTVDDDGYHNLKTNLETGGQSVSNPKIWGLVLLTMTMFASAIPR